MIGHYSDLAGKTILVTGASSGIGRAIAIALAHQKARVVITGRNSERLQETMQAMGGEAILIPADLTMREERERLIHATPALDGVCHAAGIIHPFPIRYIDEEQFDKVFNINGRVPILLTSRLLGKKKVNKAASIVFISSVSSQRGMKGGSIYSASKAALEAFSRAITLENVDKKIRANCLRPAMVKTAMYDQAKAYTEAVGAIANYENHVLHHSLGEGTPEDVAAATLFLLSEASRWITSTSLVLDGGLSASI
ncbi:MAG: family oxidoreductase [Moraxellaceae bacterium]|jgi:NAD(P)-dependent dehydrogenase (short-subunit alcohol dehydrogenase family)|nr:family oxidoreductase [Moraxellaceae bacterium]